MGEIAVCKELLILGFEVCVEFGNHLKVDLIALDENYKTYKIHGNKIKSNNGTIQVYSIKIVLTQNVIRLTLRNKLIFSPFMK